MARKINDPEPYLSRSLQEYILLQGFVRANRDVDLSTDLFPHHKRNIRLNNSILTAAMQSVTGPKLAIGVAKLGGAGVIFCSQPEEDEEEMVREVKRCKAGFVTPEVLSPDYTIQYAMEIMEKTGYSKFPVTDNGASNGILLGLLTDNDFDSELHNSLTVKERMRKIENLNVAYDDEVRDDIKTANRKLREGHHSVLPIIYRDGRLKNLVFRKDMLEHEKNPLELLDNEKRYVVGAAINTHNYEKRVPALVGAGADFLVVDTSQGYSEYMEKTILYLKKNYPEIPIIGGNIVTPEGFKFLVKMGADAVKVGMGSGSICITQEQIRVGRGQATAVREVSKIRDDYFRETGLYVPVGSDGGVMTAGDILVALSFGADYTMVGGYVAGAEESNGPEDVKKIEFEGKLTDMRVKHYWGEGSKRAREWAGERYYQTQFEEGFEKVVPYAGPLRDRLLVALAQIRDGMRKAGCYSIKELHENADLEVRSPLSIRLSETKSGGVL